MLNERQFGFRKGKACVTNLLCFYSRATDVVQERNGWVDCVYLDLQKAFDKFHTRGCSGSSEIGEAWVGQL